MSWKCPVCFECVYKPYTLNPCNHSLCHNCVNSIEQQICPGCRTHIQSSRPNFALIEVLESLQPMVWKEPKIPHIEFRFDEPKMPQRQRIELHSIDHLEMAKKRACNQVILGTILFILFAISMVILFVPTYLVYVPNHTWIKNDCDIIDCNHTITATTLNVSLVVEKTEYTKRFYSNNNYCNATMVNCWYAEGDSTIVSTLTLTKETQRNIHIVWLLFGTLGLIFCFGGIFFLFFDKM